MKKKRFQRNETEKGIRVKNFQKEKKVKSQCNKKGMKCDLKYIYKKLSMNLQLRSDNEKYLKQSQIGRTQCENSVKYSDQIHDYMCTFK